MAGVDTLHVLLGVTAAGGGIAIVMAGLFLSFRVRISDDLARNLAIGKAISMTAAFLALIFVVSVLSYW